MTTSPTSTWDEPGSDDFFVVDVEYAFLSFLSFMCVYIYISRLLFLLVLYL